MKSGAFPKSFRLLSEKDFRSLFSVRDKISSAAFYIKYKKNFLPVPRLGMVLSKKKTLGPWTAIA